MALADRKHNRRIFEKQGSGKDRMDDDKITRISASFAANVHVDHPELPDATEAVIYALQGIEEDVQELHRYLGAEVDRKDLTPYVLNSGFHSRTTSRVYMPLTTAAYNAVTSTNGYLEYGAWCAPCNGYVDYVVVRSEQACGKSTVGIHIASNGTEMPGFNPGTFLSPTVDMTTDDTAYKFTSFTNQGGTSNSFTAGQVVVISIDPQYTPEDTVATIVFKLDWTNTL